VNRLLFKKAAPPLSLKLGASLAALALAALGGQAFAQSALPPQSPILRIEAGGPAGAVTHIAVSADGKLMALAGYDKVVRLYSLPDGVERAVLRPPIGAGEEGELYAVALTPDGKTLFTAGDTGGSWDGSFSLYMVSTASNRLLARLSGLPSPVYDLAVSPDGTRLAAGLVKGGVWVWDARTGRETYSDSAYNGPVRNLRFDGQDDLFTASADGHIRAYDPAGTLHASTTPEPGLHPWGLAVSPDGGFIAVSFETARSGRAVVDVLKSTDLSKAFSPDTTGLPASGLLALTWAVEKNGASLLAGGYAQINGHNIIRRWGDFGLGTPVDTQAAGDTIRDIKALPGGGAVYASDDPGWGRLAPDGSLAQSPQPVLADLRPSRASGLGVSDDGTIVEFTTHSGVQKFDANTRSLTAIGSLDPSIAKALTSAPPLNVTTWQDTNAPSLNGTRLKLDLEEFSRSLAILPDRNSFVLGTDTALRHYDATGKLLATTPVEAAAWAVSVNDTGTVLAAALLDGTIHLYGINPDGSLSPRATLFAASDNQRWVLFTPDGFFDEADLGGQNLVGFHVNQGPNQQPEWVSFSQAFKLFHAPDVVKAALSGNNAPAQTALAAIGDLRNRLIHEPEIAVATACVQVQTVCTPVPFTQTQAAVLGNNATSLTVTVNVQDRGLGIGALDLFVNGRNTGRVPPPALNGGKATEQVTVPLDPGDNDVVLRQYDGDNAIYAESTPLQVTRATPAQPARGALYVVAIGIDHFATPAISLDLAVSDATSFSQLVSQAAGPLYSSTHVTLLTDGQATKAGILAALSAVAAQAQPQDTFLFYIASHGGVNSTDNKFLLIPQDIHDLSSWNAIEAQAITEDQLVSALAQIRARDSLLFIDTCYSGNFSAASLANVGQESGRYIISAASSTQEALDSYNGHDGLVIYALRQGFEGAAPHDSQGVIGALSLGEYVSGEISSLASARGHTQNGSFTAAQAQLNSFPVGEVPGS
jgi:WD40 repeat protein